MLDKAFVASLSCPYLPVSNKVMAIIKITEKQNPVRSNCFHKTLQLICNTYRVKILHISKTDGRRSMYQLLKNKGCNCHIYVERQAWKWEEHVNIDKFTVYQTTTKHQISAILNVRDHPSPTVTQWKQSISCTKALVKPRPKTLHTDSLTVIPPSSQKKICLQKCRYLIKRRNFSSIRFQPGKWKPNTCCHYKSWFKITINTPQIINKISKPYETYSLQSYEQPLSVSQTEQSYGENITA